MDIRIVYDESLKAHVAYINGEALMKNKHASTLCKKLHKWLQSQGK